MQMDLRQLEEHHSKTETILQHINRERCVTNKRTTQHRRPQHHRSRQTLTDVPGIFIGNLSYFCEDQHLQQLCAQYGHVERVRVCRSDDQIKPLQYGFATMSTRAEAEKVVNALQGQLFMGRKLRLAISEGNRSNNSGFSSRPPRIEEAAIVSNSFEEGVQVHVSFCSFFHSNEVEGNLSLKPTESFLRRHLVDYGLILDVTVKDYQQYRDSNMQEGYGFVTFSRVEEALEASRNCQDIVVDGITLKCTMTHRNRKNELHNYEIPYLPLSAICSCPMGITNGDIIPKEQHGSFVECSPGFPPNPLAYHSPMTNFPCQPPHPQPILPYHAANPPIRYIYPSQPYYLARQYIYPVLAPLSNGMPLGIMMPQQHPAADSVPSGDGSQQHGTSKQFNSF